MMRIAAIGIAINLYMLNACWSEFKNTSLISTKVVLLLMVLVPYSYLVTLITLIVRGD